MIDATRPHYSDDAIRRFLLGRLDEAEQSLFEQSLFADDGLAERVRLVEIELADEYASDRLSAAQRQTLRESFLLTAARAQLVTTSKALYENLTPAPVIRNAARLRIGDIFNVRRHIWKYAFAILILMLLLTTALLIRKERSQIAGDERSKSPRSEPRPSASQSPISMNHSHSVPPRGHNQASPALPLHEGLATTVVLFAGTSSDSSPVISVGGDVLTIELMLNQPLAESYDVNVLKMSGEPVFTATNVKRGDGEMLGFELTANSLGTGDFQVELRSRSDEAKSPLTYYFRVR